MYTDTSKLVIHASKSYQSIRSHLVHWSHWLYQGERGQISATNQSQGFCYLTDSTVYWKWMTNRQIWCTLLPVQILWEASHCPSWHCNTYESSMEHQRPLCPTLILKVIKELDKHLSIWLQLHTAYHLTTSRWIFHNHFIIKTLWFLFWNILCLSHYLISWFLISWTMFIQHLKIML